MSGDVGSGRRGKEGDEVGYFFGLSETACRDDVDYGFFIETLQHVGFDEAGRYGIDGDTFSGNFLGERFGGCDDAALCGGVVGLTRRSFDTADAAHGDDAAVFVNKHVLKQGDGNVVEAVEGNVEDTPPIIRGCEDEEVVASDARVIHERFHVVVWVEVLPGFEGGVHLLRVADVELHRLAVASCLAYHLKGDVGFGGVGGIIDKERVAHSGEADADGAPYSATASCY